MAHFRFRRSFGNVNGRMFRGARPLVQYLLNLYRGAAAAYSLRSLSRAWRKEPVVEVRRASDDTTKSFTATDIGDGTMANWVNATVALPLDTASGAAAAYSLRNLSTSYSGNVVNVRRSSDNATADFTAADVADGSLETWVNTDVSGSLNAEDGSLAGWGPVNFDGSSLGVSIESSSPISGTKSYKLIDSNGTVTNFGYPRLIVPVPALTYETGGSYNVKMKIKLVSGAADVYGMLGAMSISSARVDIGSLVVGEVKEVDVNVTPTITPTSQFYLRFNGTLGPFEILIDDIIITQTAANGHVTKWYDQSGNDNHAEQTTEASQPKIVDGGTLVADGIQFDGAQWVGIDSDIGLSGTDNPISYFAVADAGNDSASTPRTIVGLGHSTLDALFDITKQAEYYRLLERDDARLLRNFNVGTFDATSVISGISTGNNRYLYANGSNLATGSEDLGQKTFDRLTVGALRNDILNNPFVGSISEVIIYDSDQSDNRIPIESNMADYYGDIDLPPGFDSGNNEVDGYVTTWYDQSGNGNDAVQTVATSQPKIVENGVLVADGIKFDGGQYLSNTALGSSFAGTAVPFSAFSTLKLNGLTGNMVPFAFGSTTNTNPIYEPLISASGSWGYYVRDDSGVSKDDLTLTTGSLNAEVLSCTSTGSLLDFFQNGTASAAAEDISLGALTTNVFAIGALVRSTILNYFDGSISEVIIYDSDQSAKRTDIEGNINDYYEIFADETYRRPDGSAIFRPDGTSVYERP